MSRAITSSGDILFPEIAATDSAGFKILRCGLELTIFEKHCVVDSSLSSLLKLLEFAVDDLNATADWVRLDFPTNSWR